VCLSVNKIGLRTLLFNLKKKDTGNLMMVIFIDDLDRCTPERALQILESIKARVFETSHSIQTTN
jgi:predicted KAP-like P-loop ATPase